MIRVLVFGRMQDVLGLRETAVEAAPGLTLHVLRERLFSEALTAGTVDVAAIKASHNAVVTTDDTPLSDGDEVAFFSVFSGG